jgi:integrase
MLKLQPPREGKTPSYYIRGTYLEQRVYQSAGTGDKAVAQRELAKIKKDIEAGRFTDRRGPTFADAVVGYIQGGGNRRFLPHLVRHFKETPLESIDQKAIQKAAETLYPNAPPSTINRQVYTPISAVLKRAGFKTPIDRPKGHDRKRRVRWLRDEAEAGRLFEEAAKVDRELATLLILLVYTGMRLGEALGLDHDDLDLNRTCLYLPTRRTESPGWCICLRMP